MATGMYGIESVSEDTPGALTCAECGMSWAEDITPAGRCPWEHDHEYGEDESALTAPDWSVAARMLDNPADWSDGQYSDLAEWVESTFATELARIREAGL